MSEAAIHRWREWCTRKGCAGCGPGAARHRAIVELYEILASIDVCYRPSQEEVAAAAGVTPETVRAAMMALRS